MNRRTLLQGMGAAAALPFMGGLAAEAQSAEVGPDTVYELRIYHTSKLEALLARFGGQETKLFEKAGMHCVGFWTPTDDPLKGATLIYLLRHKSREAADASWKAFRADPEWQKVKAESEKDGTLVDKNESTFMALTSFSPKV
ncbi:MAG TPA: NIPSNAP family protein [Edaphobacter sp.]